ncbi:MAG: hypothetical protein NW224_13115 [Leptolyngbyaceae cyanobacterium bins.302]|nr:hypothetical protein [Leptolyngbyaceae cyanobacterium bins.302]
MTNANQVLTIPNPEQQHWLKQRVIYEIALYNRQQRSRKLPFQRVIRAVQGIQTAMQRGLSLVGSTPQPETFATQARPSSLTLKDAADVPVKRLLLAVQERLYAAEVSGLAVFETSTSLSISSFSASATGTIAIAANLSQPLASQSRKRIRGVASLLANRKLVLVADSNQVLDVLTFEQHQLLYQRIAWEVASYRRYMTLQQQVSRFTPLPSPITKNNLVLPPVRAFQRLMAWMQSGAVAMATNLFQEAWVAALLPASDLPASDDELATSAIADPIPSIPPVSRFAVRDRLLLPIRTFRTLFASQSASNSVSPVSIYSATLQPVTINAVGGLVVVPSNAAAIVELGSEATHLQPFPTESTALTNAVSRLNPLVEQGRTTRMHTQSKQTAKPVADERKRSPDYIDTHVTWVDYEQSWLERVMRWLDHCFLWIETVISNLWKMLRQS